MHTCLKADAKCPRCGAALDRLLRTIDDHAGTATLILVHEDESDHQLSGDLDPMRRLFDQLTEPR